MRVGEDIVKDALNDICGIEVTDFSSSIIDLGFDTLDTIHLLMTFEEEEGVVLDEELFDIFETDVTVQNIIDHIDSMRL